MKFSVAFFFCLLSCGSVQAQFIRVNGDATTRAKLPIKGVAVMAFDKGEMIKSYVTDDKGEYSFRVDRMKFDVLFYKPGLLTHDYTVNNRLDREVQGININVEMDDSLAETVVDKTQWLKRHHLSAAHLDSLYQAEIARVPAISPRQARRNQRELLKAARAEQKRFSNYKTATVAKSINNEQNEVTTIRIGPDRYRMVEDKKGDKKYFKNIKPITESTYKFETTRRYEGVLKDEKSVKHFDKYKPMEHVKTQDD
jgi:hypothetical protein